VYLPVLRLYFGFLMDDWQSINQTLKREQKRALNSILGSLRNNLKGIFVTSFKNNEL
jgi:hypothetical protein